MVSLKSPLRIAVGIAFVILVILIYSEYSSQRDYKELSTLCSSIKVGSSNEAVMQIVNNSSFNYQLSGKTASISKGLCRCIVVIDNGLVTQNIGAACVE